MAKEYIFASVKVEYNDEITFDFRPEGDMANDIKTYNYLIALVRAIAGKDNDGQRNPD